MTTALLASFLAALATGLGGALVVFLPRLSRELYNVLLGFSAGVMLAAGTLATFRTSNRTLPRSSPAQRNGWASCC